MTLPEGWRFRANWRGKLILQRRFRVMVEFPGYWDFVWHDASVEDLRVLFKEIK